MVRKLPVSQLVLHFYVLQRPMMAHTNTQTYTRTHIHSQLGGQQRTPTQRQTDRQKFRQTPRQWPCHMINVQSLAQPRWAAAVAKVRIGVGVGDGVGVESEALRTCLAGAGRVPCELCGIWQNNNNINASLMPQDYSDKIN